MGQMKPCHSTRVYDKAAFWTEMDTRVCILINSISSLGNLYTDVSHG